MKGQGALASDREATPVASSAPSTSPFFIVGTDRSGTTMLRLMLNKHRRLCVPPESHFVSRLVRANPMNPSLSWFLEQLRGDERFNEWNLPLTAIAARVGQKPVTWRLLFDAAFGEYADQHGKPRWGDKTPMYVRELDLLAEVFPDLKVIHIIRDGRDVASSLKSVWWNQLSIIEIAIQWRDNLVGARRFGQKAGASTYLEVRYEDLVNNPEPLLRDICRHLGEDYDSQMLKFYEDAEKEVPTHRQAWHGNTKNPVNNSSIQRWRRDLTEAEVTLFEWFAGSMLKATGYRRNRSFSLRAVKPLREWYRQQWRQWRTRRQAQPS